MSDMEMTDILKMLPHRYPFQLVDRILECDLEEKRIVGLKNVTANEPYFPGHFPGRPIMPAVLQLEAMAQTGGILLYRISGEGGLVPFFMSIDKAKFRRIVVPGDQLRIEVSILKLRSRSAKFAGRALVDGTVVSQAELMCMVSEERGEA